MAYRIVMRDAVNYTLHRDPRIKEAVQRVLVGAAQPPRQAPGRRTILFMSVATYLGGLALCSAP